ncbi:MAG: tetratricopeptide repeat protein [Candidatus Gastranaerophilaceae bacterium]|jgi:tetratricopeptide (TPR) repeat protein
MLLKSSIKILVFLFFTLIITTGTVFAYAPLAEAKYNQGLDFNEKDNYVMAITCFEESVKIDPSLIDAYFNMGVLYEYTKQNNKAVAAFEQVLKNNPSDGEAAFRLASNYYKIGEYKKAMSYATFVTSQSVKYRDSQELCKKISQKISQEEQKQKDLLQASPTGISKNAAGNVYVANYIGNVTASKYYDLDNKKIAREINFELQDEQENILQDLRVLWQAAAQNSETIKFAIYKLSKPDGEKIDENVVKKILEPIANIAPMIGSSMTNSAVVSSSVLGGGILKSMLSDDSKINKRLTKVTDADLIILAKEIDDLQQRLVGLYYNYITALKVLNYSDKMVKNRYDYYNWTSTKKSTNVAIADTFYRDSLDKQYKARQELMSTRAALEQFVGNEALIEVEKNIKSRVITD